MLAVKKLTHRAVGRVVERHGESLHGARRHGKPAAGTLPTGSGGRPHVTPLLAIWLDSALCFCTGASERKAKNLALNPHCIRTTGRYGY